MAPITNVRAGRVAALLVALQAAKGTPASDFASGSAGRIWTDQAQDDAGPTKSDAGGWMTQPQLETAGRYSLARPFRGAYVCKATPTSLEWLLRSNWGPYASGAWTLAAGVSEWLTLGWVEDVARGAGYYFHRTYDAWIHRLTLRASALMPLSLSAEWAAERDSEPQDLAALAGVTLPASAMAPEDRDVFPGRLVRLYRDPLGDNEELALDSVEISLDQGLGTAFDMMQGVSSVWKGGYPGPRVGIRFESHVSAETWALLSSARAGAKERFRLLAQCQDPAKTLQIDFHQVDFAVEPLGHDGTKYARFRGAGQAHRDDDGNFVDISIF